MGLHAVEDSSTSSRFAFLIGSSSGAVSSFDASGSSSTIETPGTGAVEEEEELFDEFVGVDIGGGRAEVKLEIIGARRILDVFFA